MTALALQFVSSVQDVPVMTESYRAALGDEQDARGLSKQLHCVPHDADQTQVDHDDDEYGFLCLIWH